MTTLSISELATLGGVSRRTVRYYVQRGLIPAPTGVGRGRHYTQAHLDALLRVKRLQQGGASLESIAGEEHDSEPATKRLSAAAAAPRGRWWRIEVAEGVELHLEDRRGLDPARVTRAVTALRAALAHERGGPARDD